MSSRIIKLDRQIYDKIAAGEVVERPASIVKELIENAIDAKATRITIEIQKGGKERIRIVDNGIGIHPEDVLVAFDRHATSKIRQVDDIYAIGTLGFRGEALSSIAAVSHAVMTTKQSDQDQGVMVEITGGVSKPIRAVGCPNGTSVDISELFHNTPARLKFLKSDLAEQTAITDLISRLALSHPEIAMTYYVDKRQIFNTRGDGDTLSAIAAVHGIDMAKQLIPVDITKETPHGAYRLKGQVSKITHTRGNRAAQLSYVNGRFVKSDMVMESIKMAYGHAIPVGRFPVAFLYFEVPKDQVDVNIHPSKTEVKFHEEGLMKQLIYEGLKSSLMAIDQTNRPEVKPVPAPIAARIDTPISNPSKAAEVQPAHQPVLKPSQQPMAMPSNPTTPSNPMKPSNPTMPSVPGIKSPQAAEFQPSQAQRPSPAESQKPEPVEYKQPAPSISPLKALQMLEKMSSYSETVQQSAVVHLDEPNRPYKDLRYIGQVFNSYLLFERANELCMIDQHAAHEKVLFESLKSNYEKKSFSTQILLVPYTISLDQSDYDQVLAASDFMASIGIIAEDFGNRTIIIREVPILFNDPAPLSFIEKVVDELKTIDLEQVEQGNHPYDRQMERIILESCKSAVKANQALDVKEVGILLDKLSELENPYTCPHGRPILVALGRDKIDRLFYRS